MKTVSTKLDKQTFEKFQEMYNDDGLQNHDIII